MENLNGNKIERALIVSNDNSVDDDNIMQDDQSNDAEDIKINLTYFFTTEEVSIS